MESRAQRMQFFLQRPNLADQQTNPIDFKRIAKLDGASKHRKERI